MGSPCAASRVVSLDGTVFVSQGQSADTGGRGGRGGRGGALYNADAPPTPCQLALSNESYGRIYRTLRQQVPVTLDVDIKNSYHTENGLDSFNIVAEIPGHDLAQQVVMLGAHFDSWQSATGATDNAAGAAVMMEAMRLLKSTGLPMRRTVRIGLWGGEEEGELGSKAYVRAHFRGADGAMLPDQKLISAYYNMDNGSGAIRGIFLQGDDGAGPIFAEWMKPLRDLGMTTPATRNDGSTDHLSFDAAGIPGFEFVQDELDYFVRTHHSSADTVEHVIPQDMERDAIIVASFVYLTANRPELLAAGAEPTADMIQGRIEAQSPRNSERPARHRLGEGGRTPATERCPATREVVRGTRPACRPPGKVWVPKTRSASWASSAGRATE